MTTVSTTVRTRRRLRVPRGARGRGRGGAALAGLVVALVVGIVGMHALTSHGSHAGPAASDQMSMVGGHSSAVPHSAPGDTGSAGDTRSGADHDLAGMAMLCVVMLAAAAVTLLALLAIGVLRPVRSAAFLPAAVRRRTVRWARATGPPPVWQFSVIRC